MNETIAVQGQGSPVAEYFTKEINDRIASMTDNQMIALLKDLEGSAFWVAILRYNQQRLLHLQGALMSGDPVGDPSSMRLNQGVMLGLSDLQSAVIHLITPKKEDPGATVMGR